ncbi:response regulator [Clostridium saccharoperbutylacetonicum]|uniref:response regulator n=1 Tax=Clostridium saccharoperbutylacetonicum TaxID=36745 RepID=UPI0039EB0809
MKKVLIVDDSSYMRMMVRKVVEKGGLCISFEAASAGKALEVFKNEKPDIVTLDLNMSEFRMDGMNLLSDMIKMNPEVHVVVVTAIGYEDVKERCIALGAKGYLIKPFNAKELLNVLPLNDDEFSIDEIVSESIEKKDTEEV